MENHSGDHKLSQNKLWIARKRAGYLQKWVATIAGLRSPSIVSEYEKGRKLPSLQAAIKLELIYQTPLAELFPNLYSKLAREVEEAKLHHAPILKRDEEVNIAQINLMKVGLRANVVVLPTPLRSPADPC